MKKNPHLILRACALQRDEGQDFLLVMAGAGQDLERLKGLAASLRLQDRVIFTGFVAQREAVLSLCRRADLLVFPSVYDTPPWWSGKRRPWVRPPCWCAAAAQAEGVTHGDNGFLCEADPASIASGNHGGAPRAARAGARARDNHSHPMGLADGTVLERYRRLIARHAERSPA